MICKYGRLAFEYTGKRLPLSIIESDAGFYIGTFDDSGFVSRESECYFRTSEEAEYALKNFNGDLQLSPNQLGDFEKAHE